MDACKLLASKKKRVIVAGLDSDYKGLPFGPMPNIMCEADYIDKLRAICILCCNPASFTHSSIAILDSLRAINKPKIEIHL